MSPSLSPSHGLLPVSASSPAPMLCCAAMSREQFGLFFWGTALPCMHGEGGGPGQGATCSVWSQHVPGKWSPQSILSACSEQGLPLLHLTQLKLNKSGCFSFFLLSSFSVSPLGLSTQRPAKPWLVAGSCNPTSSVPTAGELPQAGRETTQLTKSSSCP